MFGYVLPLKAELKVKEWYAYCAVYCGLCKELKRKYGFVARMFLNYDFVLLALIADGIMQSEIEVNAERCIANPVQKRPVCAGTQGLSLAADALIITAFYKIVDNLSDEKFVKKIPSAVLYPIINSFRKKAAKNYPNLDKTLASETVNQQNIEAQKLTSADAAADATANMTAVLFEAAGGGKNSKELYKFGYFLGKIIYYLDCAEDYEKDKKSGAYNIFVLQGLTKEQTVQEVKRLCKLNAGEMSLNYSALQIENYKQILDNIIYLGIPECIESAGQEKKKVQNGGKV